MDSTPSPEVLLLARPKKRRWQSWALDPLFVVLVVLPTVLGGVYFAAIASDVFISESRFIVRSPQRGMPSGLGALLQGTGFSRSQDDTHTVHDYIRSRDALRELEAKYGFRQRYSNVSVDFGSRFGVGFDKSFEALHRYYDRQVSVEFDPASSISVLRVRAFDPADAKAINDTLLQMSEKLVNALNTRSRQDLVAAAEADVKVAEARAREAALALSVNRRDGGVYDPDRQSALQLAGVSKMQEELMAAELQVAQLKALSPNNAQLAPLEARAQGIRKAIEAELAKVTGRSGSLASKAPAFDRLAVEKAFADRQLAAAFASLESARSEAQRKQLYLERIVEPNLPDMSVEPRRLRSAFSVFIVALIAWAIIRLIVASIREHTD